jgi:predicted oxidoreductase
MSSKKERKLSGSLKGMTADIEKAEKLDIAAIEGNVRARASIIRFETARDAYAVDVKRIRQINADKLVAMLKRRDAAK